MTKEKQLIAIAELDGKCPHLNAREIPWADAPTRGSDALCNDCGRYVQDHPLPLYLTSRDAIIPVIEKQDKYTQVRIGVELELIIARDFGCDSSLLTSIDLVKASAEQLAEALLRANGGRVI